MSEDRIKETADMIEEKDGTIREDGEAVIDETEQFEDFLEEGAEELVEGEDAGDGERPDTRRIKVLQGRYMAEDAAWIIGKKSKDIRVTNVNVLFYPYSKILYKIDMGEKLQRLNDKVLCMLDLYTGRLSFATKPGKFSLHGEAVIRHQAREIFLCACGREIYNAREDRQGGRHEGHPPRYRGRGDAAEKGAQDTRHHPRQRRSGI